MNVLSLFDGISCGRVALERANIKVAKYYASEIDKHAIKVSQNNYPDIIRLGDINNWQSWNIDWSSIDLILAGSPCQGFSFCGKQLAFDDPRSKLYFVFEKILKHTKKLNPSVNFLLENVRMKLASESIITRRLFTIPVKINSDLLSAQNRERIYWLNWKVEQPKDKKIYLKDIVEKDLSHYVNVKFGSYDKIENVFNVNPSCTGMNGRVYSILGKSPTLTTNKGQGVKIGINVVGVANDTKNRIQHKRIYSISGKAPTIVTASGGGHQPKIAIDDFVYRDMLPIEAERCQTLPDNYTECVSKTQRFNTIGNGWTIDVIAHILKSIPNQKELTQ